MENKSAKYAALPTEQRNPASERLDTLSTTQLTELIFQQDMVALSAVAEQQEAIARAVDRIAAAFARHGRLIYVGAGTSGRLGLLDAAECPPTFSSDPRQVVGLLAGGAAALIQAVEGAEDSLTDGIAELKQLGVSDRDIVCGISASGTTPYVRATLNWAREQRIETILVSCGDRASLAAAADTLIAIAVGPEILTGSTRMKAGLATKSVLHTLTTAAMVRSGKVYDNLMVDVRPTSDKLKDRARRIVSLLGGVDPAEAEALLKRANDRSKVAILMARTGLDSAAAEAQLAQHGGQLRPLIGDVLDGGAQQAGSDV
ncbi:MAG: N-acetylmuramic acid 6-phosphate etherase [Deltaproteobacteria bacterium]|nr:N-acetylmuramic acid 6-phosphate etherase [Deltaproteobacteria bacterium]